MRAAEFAHRLVERLGPLEVADVASAWNHDQLRVPNLPIELPGDAKR
jgi:hypothetical protein